ncbi:hydantoinase [Fusarium heterosporum]|uniref:Hydantoinase n=1 Tax=Fusarium heterosporum TaxID=42747 RepID=A0A8H5U5V8_FUSHE|nr:hydantoinase [Fusarium heterosporum]
MAVISTPTEPFPYRIGVDVGGTNTDAVIVDTRLSEDPANSIIAAKKAPTTFPSVTDGIKAAVQYVLDESNIDRRHIASLSIGTTHFINAIVERDERHLSKVAVVRLSKSFTREVPPFSDFPNQLKDIMCGYCTQVDGGLQIDGGMEAPIVESQVIEACTQIRQRRIKAVVVCGVFSPLDHHFHQEDTVRRIINRELPEASVTCSSEISNLGFLERENASILNASIHKFAQRTIREFKIAMKSLGLQCGLYLTQNDGTLLDAATAARLPIRTFSSGPTNSMRGAAYLCKLYTAAGHGAPTAIVCDIGGTTTDVGVLLPSGYPRQAVGDVSIGGVRVNYGMPQVESIGIGGGSIIREKEDGSLTVGRDSVGYAIKTRALVFGGTTTTATDVMVAAGGKVDIGNLDFVTGISQSTIAKTRAVIKREYEKICDLMKTSPAPLSLILVGGGSIICPPQLDGISEIIWPPFHDVANAVGAATARISATVDLVQNASIQTVAEAMHKATTIAIQRVVAAGARPESVIITEKESLPLQYVDHQVRTVIKAVGDFVPSKACVEQWDEDEGEMEEDDPEDGSCPPIKPIQPVEQHLEGSVDIENYKPKIVVDARTQAKTWVVSSTDLGWLAEGCYVLGCGGGGSPYPEMLKLRQHLQQGHELRIIDMESLDSDARIYWAGNMGSPAVPAERLSASESILAMDTMMEYNNHDSFDAMIGIEIGGSNGLQPLTIGSSLHFDRPVVDADWMGRAYPNLWQVIVAVQESNQILPCAIASGDGRALVMTKSPDDKLIDQTLRAPAIEMGYYVGFCAKPTTVDLVHRWAIKNTMSQAWRIGRCIARANKNNTMSTVTEQIIEEMGGGESAKVLFRGKIVEVERRLFKGHSHGEVVIKYVPADIDHEHNGHQINPPPVATGGELRIPFMNENLFARHRRDDGSEVVIAAVPDLITVINSANGKALGIGEYRYGMLVNILGMACSPVWNKNHRGLKSGGLAAFGYDDIEYRPLGIYKQPRSVIEEFS